VAAITNFNVSRGIVVLDRGFINTIRRLFCITKKDKHIIQNFVDAINEHNVDKISSHLTEDHKFVDSQGNEVIGKEHMKTGWIGCFQWFPDYKIEITDIFFNGDTIALFGFASGTFQDRNDRKENYWRLPASWKAILKNGKINLWQVYTDSKIPFDIINKNRKQ